MADATFIIAYGWAQTLLGIAVAVGGAVMWWRSRRAGWAPVLLLVGIGQIWESVFATVFAGRLNEELNQHICSTTACIAPFHAWVWHVMHVWDASFPFRNGLDWRTE